LQGESAARGASAARGSGNTAVTSAARGSAAARDTAVEPVRARVAAASHAHH
jgi:hypothetical protein